VDAFSRKPSIVLSRVPSLLFRAVVFLCHPSAPAPCRPRVLVAQLPWRPQHSGIAPRHFFSAQHQNSGVAPRRPPPTCFPGLEHQGRGVSRSVAFCRAPWFHNRREQKTEDTMASVQNQTREKRNRRFQDPGKYFLVETDQILRIKNNLNGPIINSISVPAGMTGMPHSSRQSEMQRAPSRTGRSGSYRLEFTFLLFWYRHGRIQRVFPVFPGIPNYFDTLLCIYVYILIYMYMYNAIFCSIFTRGSLKQ
jgi:hypothetical protein